MIITIKKEGRAVRKYSRQREIILKTLQGVTCHPSASWIYDQVRREIPNISLGTVYRNLSELRGAGEIISFTPGDGTERFDANTSPHYHFFCESCRAVLDIPLARLTDLDRTVERETGCCIQRHQLMFYGLCPACKKASDS